jgi:hypothetical protein
MILPDDFYGCETWSLILREERRLRVFENRVLKRTFGPKRDEETGGRRKLHNEYLTDLYLLIKCYSGDQTGKMKLAVNVARMGTGKVHTGFWWKNVMERDHLKYSGADGRIILRCFFRKWNGGTDWIDVDENGDRYRAFLNVVWNYRVP